MIKTVRPDVYAFSVVIEFPSAPSGVIGGREVRIWRTDVTPEVEIESCESLAIHMDAEGVAWAEARMWADPDGNPLFDGKPMVKDNQIITAVFSVHVAKILSKPSYNKGYEEGYVQLYGKPLSAAKRMRGRKMVEA